MFLHRNRRAFNRFAPLCTAIAAVCLMTVAAAQQQRPFRIAISIGDVATMANLDSGAAVALVLPRKTFDRAAGGRLEEAGRARLTNSSIETERGLVHGPLRAGGIRETDIEARVSDRYPEALIGAEILQHYMIAIDQRSMVVALCGPRR